MQPVWIALAVLMLGWPAGASAGQPDACSIVDGASIAGVRIGMTTAAVLALTGSPLGQQVAGGQVIYTLRPPWSSLVTERGIAQRIGTRAGECRTLRHVGPGSAAAAVRQAYAGAAVSSVTPTAEGDLLSYPFIGIGFLLRGERVVAVEVFRPEGAPSGTAPRGVPTGPVSPALGPAGVPGASPTAATRIWNIRSASARVEGYTLVVTGTVENNGRTQSAYAEVRAFNLAGREAATGDGPLYPSPVPGGKTATFEARMTIDEIIRRYTITIRPIGSLSATLAESSGEVTDLRGFEAIVARSVTLAVQLKASPPTPTDFVLVVTNGSPLTIARVTVAVEIRGTCRIRRIPLPAPVPTATFQEAVTASTTIEQLAPGASARANLQLPERPCLQFDTWSAQPRIVELRVGN